MQVAMTEAQQEAKAMLVDNARLSDALTEKTKAVKELLAKQLQLQELADGLDTRLSKVNVPQLCLSTFTTLLLIVSTFSCSK